MIGHLPPPYGDELVTSILARFGVRFDFPSTKNVGSSAFGKSTSTMIVDFPTYLESLADSLPRTMGITANSLIDNNTLWPYYAAFSSQVSGVNYSFRSTTTKITDTSYCD